MHETAAEGSLLEAVIFDLDGVLTLTARVHAQAWKALFDQFLAERAERLGTPFVPFDVEDDYRAYVDGRPRLDGVRAFLGARGISLPEGAPDDPPGTATIHGLAKLKDRWFRELIDRFGVDVDPAAAPLAAALRARGVAVGVASSSRNCVPLLRRAGLLHLWDAIVDGVDVERLHLAGKPGPDLFLECLRRLGTRDASRAAVVEDAAAGVAAARAGGFGLVIGVDRGGNRDRLFASGADWVVRGLAELSPEGMEARLETTASARRGSVPASGGGSPSPSVPGSVPFAPSMPPR